MPRISRGRQRTRGAKQPAPSAGRATLAVGWVVLVPVLVTLVLNLPSLGLGYFWDDFNFLTSQGQGGYRNYLLPDPHSAFYRPIPQGAYFALLRFADPSSGILGHVLDLTVLAGVVALLVLFVSDMRGPRAGLFSGLIFASYGHVASLTAWISCSQDLFAIAFVVAAFYLRHKGKDLAALACATAAVFCKEPAIAAFPVLILWDWIVGRQPARPRFLVGAYGCVFLLWLFIHPGIRLLAERGFRTGATSYVGMEHPERWGRYFIRYVMTLFNLPPQGLSVSWWSDRAKYGFAALAILVAGVAYVDRGLKRAESSKSVPLGRVGLIAALFSVPTLLMPTILVRHWAPYFACIPALGIAILLGSAIARMGRVPALAVLSGFLLLGIWSRGIYGQNEPVWSEAIFVQASRALKVVRSNFEKVFPSFPKGSQVVVSVGTTGARGISSTLLDAQALRVWYRDPTLNTVSTLRRQPGRAPEFLVRVTTDLDVIAIDPETQRIRASMSNPDFAEINRPINNYARAVAASGETDRAVRILERLAQAEPGAPAAFDRRLIASIYLAAGRRRGADSLMATTLSFSKEDALQIVQRLLGEATTSERLDTAAFEAFGLSSTDPETIHWLMLGFQRSGSRAQAAWYAQKLQGLKPGDEESASILKETRQAGVRPSREAT